MAADSRCHCNAPRAHIHLCAPCESTQQLSSQIVKCALGKHQLLKGLLALAGVGVCPCAFSQLLDVCRRLTPFSRGGITLLAEELRIWGHQKISRQDSVDILGLSLTMPSSTGGEWEWLWWEKHLFILGQLFFFVYTTGGGENSMYKTRTARSLCKWRVSLLVLSAH